MLTGWTDELNKHFASKNQFCVLAFKDNKCLRGVGNDGRIWYAKARCIHTGCASFEFSIRSDITEQSAITVYVQRKGFYSHDKEVRRRFIRSERRKAISKTLEHSPPSTVKFSMLSEVSEDILKMGNRNYAPSDVILRKISSETKQKDDLDKDFHTFLYKLKRKYDTDENYKGTYVQGLIQTHIIHPFAVVMFTERQVRYAVSLSRRQFVFAYLDSTGTIIADPPGNEKRPYYYALILPGISGLSPAFPLLEFITVCHTADFILFCLSLFVDATKHFITEGDTKPVFNKIQMDCSMALIQSTSRAFNQITILQYLKFVWSKINQDTGKIEVIMNITIIHICSSHLISAGKKRIKIFTCDDVARQYQGFVLTSLIHTKDLFTAARIVTCAVIVFCSEKKIPEFYEALDYIKKITYTGEAEECTHRVTELSEDLESRKILFPSSQREQSPFYVYFENLICDSRNELKEKQDPDFKNNEFLCIQFIIYLQNEILPIFPLISGLIIHLFGIIRDTNNAVENWFGFVKNVEFARKLKNLIPRFIQRHELSMDGRFKEVMYGLTSTRQIKGRKKNGQKENEIPNSEVISGMDAQSSVKETTFDNVDILIDRDDIVHEEIVPIVPKKIPFALKISQNNYQNLQVPKVFKTLKPCSGHQFPVKWEKQRWCDMVSPWMT